MVGVARYTIPEVMVIDVNDHTYKLSNGEPAKDKLFTLKDGETIIRAYVALDGFEYKGMTSLDQQSWNHIELTRAGDLVTIVVGLPNKKDNPPSTQLYTLMNPRIVTDSPMLGDPTKWNINGLQYPPDDSKTL